MKPFLDKDFLLSTPTAQKLFHEYAENMPIIRLPLPHQSPGNRRRQKCSSNITAGMAGRRPLQMASDAFQRC